MESTHRMLIRRQLESSLGVAYAHLMMAREEAERLRDEGAVMDIAGMMCLVQTLREESLLVDARPYTNRRSAKIRGELPYTQTRIAISNGQTVIDASPSKRP